MDRVKIIEDLKAARAALESLPTDTKFDEDQTKVYDENTAIADRCIADLTALDERAAKVDAVRNFAFDESNRIDGDAAKGIDTDKGVQHMKRTADIYDLGTIDRSVGPKAVAHEMRERALSAIETSGKHLTDSHRETATRVLETARHSDAPEIARFILQTGSEEYMDSFEAFVRSGGRERAAMSLTGANGGYMVPFTLDPTIILTNDGAANPMREICDVVTITTDDWNGVSSAGVTAEWLAEATEAADASPTVAQPTITANKAAAYLFGSYEVLADSGFASEVLPLIVDAKARLEATAFAVGSGSGQPEGVVTGVAAVTASRVAATTNDVVGAVDVYALSSALPPRYRPNASWLAEFGTINDIRQFDTSGGSAFWANLGMDTPEQLLGKPIYEASAMDTSLVSGSNDDVLIVGDFKAGYKIVDRIGLEVLYDNMVLGSNRRPSGQAGFFAYWRVGGKCVNTSAFRVLRA